MFKTLVIHSLLVNCLDTTSSTAFFTEENRRNLGIESHLWVASDIYPLGYWRVVMGLMAFGVKGNDALRKVEKFIESENG